MADYWLLEVMSDNGGVAELLGELLVRCRTGERGAFDRLVKRFYGYALSLAESLLSGRHAEAEDAVQSAFVVVLTKLGNLREAEAFPGWLRQIVRTECNRLTRGRKMERLDGEGLVSAETPLSEAVRQEHLRWVREAVENLPGVQREATEFLFG